MRQFVYNVGKLRIKGSNLLKRTETLNQGTKSLKTYGNSDPVFQNVRKLQNPESRNL